MTFVFEAFRPLLSHDQRRGLGKASQRHTPWNGKCLGINRVKPVLYPSRSQQVEMAAGACRSKLQTPASMSGLPRHTRTTRDGQHSKPRCGDLTSDLWPEVLTLATHRNRLSPVQGGRLGNPRRLSILHALIGSITTFQRHEPHRKDRSDLEGGSDEQGAQNTNILLRVKFRDAYPRWETGLSVADNRGTIDQSAAIIEIPDTGTRCDVL